MNPDSLPAGRELDALVAEKVMGWNNISRGGHGDDAFGWNPSLRGHVPPHGRIPIPCYSTSIVAAWEVVEKLRERQWYLTVSAVSESSYGGRRGGYEVKAFGLWSGSWSNYEFDAGDGAVAYELWAPTAPLAICRAALRTVGA